jgi:hypothetical protein
LAINGPVRLDHEVRTKQTKVQQPVVGGDCLQRPGVVEFGLRVDLGCEFAAPAGPADPGGVGGSWSR